MSLKLGDEAKKRAMLELTVFDQSQQLQALTESRYQAEHQQLAEIKGRSVLQRLRAVFVAD